MSSLAGGNDHHDSTAASIFNLGGDSAAEAWRLLGPQMKAEIDRLREGLRWIAAGKTGSYGHAEDFAKAILDGGPTPSEESYDA